MSSEGSFTFGSVVVEVPESDQVRTSLDAASCESRNGVGSGCASAACAADSEGIISKPRTKGRFHKTGVRRRTSALLEWRARQGGNKAASEHAECPPGTGQVENATAATTVNTDGEHDADEPSTPFQEVSHTDHRGVFTCCYLPRNGLHNEYHGSHWGSFTHWLLH